MQPESSVVGVLSPYTGGFYYGAIIAGIQRAARRRGARVVVLHTTGLQLWWPDSDALPLALSDVDGWIAVNDVSAPRFLNHVAALGRPLVYLSRRPQGVSCCTVLPDNHGGTLSAVRHLLDHGHTRIAFVGLLSQLDLRERYEGYVAAHHERGLEPDPALLYWTSNNLEPDGSDVGRQMVADGLPCTAIAAGTDKLAIGLVLALREEGVEVPEQVAVVGFDDIEKAQYVDPPLSTVRQRFDVLAGKATDTLLDHLHHATKLPNTVRVATALVTRASCGCTGSAAERVAVEAESDTGRPEALTRALLELAGATSQYAIGRSAWPEAERVAHYVHELSQGRPAPAKHLRGAWKGFVDHNHDIDSIDRAIGMTADAALAWAELDERRQYVRQGLRPLRVELMRQWRAAQHERNRYYDFVAEANGRINQALTGNEFREAKALSWLKWTRLRYGALGLWDIAASGERRLRIVSEYGAGEESLLGRDFAADEFPPRAASDLSAELGPDNVLMVVPVPGQSDNLGLLAVAGPIEVEFLDHVGSLGDWASLLGASLQRERVEQKLRESASHDALTGLPNRAQLMERLAALQEATTFGSRFAVLFLDLDDFKNVNDSLGHVAGDQLLVDIAARLSASLEAGEMVARLGGDEFAILVPDIQHEADALDVVTRIQEALRPPFELDGNVVFTSCSVGVTFSTESDAPATELLRNADTAMYRAKLEGRARHEIFHHGMHTQAMERLRLDTRLRRALERGEFALHYQPLQCQRSGRAIGAEALIRWNHPQQGLLSPSRFLAVAEEVGLAIPISRWVLETACAEAKHWQHVQGAPYVNVNLPAQHLKDPNFVALIQELLERFDLPRGALGLELVESSLVEDLDATTTLLLQLADLGVRTAIDDFGMGYSSLSYLKRLPVQTLKIDRAFIAGVPHDGRDAAIVRAVIEMGHGLDLQIVAEGVERPEQLDFLRAQGCDAVQGFLLSRPLSAGQCRNFLHAQRPRPALEESLRVS